MGEDDDTYPQLVVMPMGWSWAFYFAQAAHKDLIQKFSNFTEGDFLEAGRPPPSIVAGSTSVHAYCDNLTVFGVEPLSVQKATDAITCGLELEGFSVHERESAANYAVSVGIEINGIQGLVTCSPARRWKLRYALLWLASRPMVSGKQLERAIGHTTFAFLLCRPLLSIFSNAYDFIRAHYATPARLWVRAAEERKQAAALILFARSSLRRPFSDVVSAFDAS